MSGIFTAKTLGEGQVANTPTAIYTVPAATKGYIHYCTFVNTSATPQTVIVYYKKATNRVAGRGYLLQNEKFALVDHGDHVLHMDATDVLLAETTTAGVVDYIVTGVEET